MYLSKTWANSNSTNNSYFWRQLIFFLLLIGLLWFLNFIVLSKFKQYDTLQNSKNLKKLFWNCYQEVFQSDLDQLKFYVKDSNYPLFYEVIFFNKIYSKAHLNKLNIMMCCFNNWNNKLWIIWIKLVIRYSK